MAKENNSRNIETCGILFGQLGGEFTITHCLIPKQKGTHDSCVTTNEEQILEFQGKIFLTLGVKFQEFKLKIYSR